jgi:DNA-binding SARP family transcriptional activator/tetratricopeptide (TPR) repeat protein
MQDRHFTVRVFGPVQLAGAENRPKVPRHAFGLVAILATRHGEKIPRRQLADLLWGSRRGRSSLSQLLYSLKSILPAGVLEPGPDYVSLGVHARVDCTDFRLAVQQEDYRLALELYKGHFLEGIPYITDQFDDWRCAKAAEYELQAHSSFQAVINGELECENYKEAAGLAKRALLMFPADEQFAKLRFELLASTGENARAIVEAEAFRRFYLADHGISPAAITEPFVQNLAKLPLPHEDRVNMQVHVPLIGRDPVLSALRRQVLAARATCRVVVISGEAGIGKSRVVRHTLRRAVLDGARAFFYSCSEVEARLPYSCVGGLIREGVRTSDTLGLEEPWVGALGFLAPESFTNSRLNNPPHKRLLWEAVAHYFDLVSEQTPVALAIDNYQWIDESSRELLIYVSKRLADRPVLMMYGGRGMRHPPTYEDAHDIVLTVELDELSPEAVHSIMSAFESRSGLRLTPEVRAAIISRVGGRPFYLLETLQHLRTMEDSFVSAAEVDELCSMKLAPKLAQRFASLSNYARSIVDAAAVLNRDVPIQVLSRIAEVPLVTAADELPVLISQGILSESTTVRFAHDLMREGALSTIRPSQLCLWHLRIAEALASMKAGTSAEIALHYEAAGDRPRAYQFAKLAANEAMRLHAFSEAEEQYLRLQRCASSDMRDEADLEFTRFAARSARYTILVPILTRVRDLCSQSTDADAMLACALAEFHAIERRRRVGLDEIVSQAKRVIDIAAKQSPASISSVMWFVGDHIKRSGDFALLEGFARMLAVSADEADHNAATAMLSVAALLAAFSVDPMSALPLGDRAVIYAEDSANHILLSRALYARGTIHLLSGDLTNAETDYERAFAIADEFAPDGLVQNLHANCAVLRLEQDRLDEAEEHARAAMHATPSARRAYSFGNLALISLRRGDLEGVRHYVAALLETHATNPQTWIPVHASALLGLADIVAGDAAAAALRAAAVARAAENGRGVGDTSHIHILCARVDFAAGRRAAALERLSVAADDLTRRDFLSGSRLRLEWARLMLSSSNASPEVAAIVQEIRDTASIKGAVLLGLDAADVLAGRSA